MSTCSKSRSPWLNKDGGHVDTDVRHEREKERGKERRE